MYLRGIAKYRPNVAGNLKLKPNVFWKRLFYDALEVIYEVLWLYFDAFTLKAASKMKEPV